MQHFMNMGTRLRKGKAEEVKSQCYARKCAFASGDKRYFSGGYPFVRPAPRFLGRLNDRCKYTSLGLVGLVSLLFVFIAAASVLLRPLCIRYRDEDRAAGVE